MRNPKFRIWDKIDKNWLFGYELLGGFSLIGEVVLMGELNSVKLERWNDMEIMQYTGLKDKNGREIYEGDVVNVATNHIADLAPDRPKTTTTVEVKFELAMFMFGDMTMNYFPLREAELEVIGNIYENPELLDKKVK